MTETKRACCWACEGPLWQSDPIRYLLGRKIHDRAECIEEACAKKRIGTVERPEEPFCDQCEPVEIKTDEPRGTLRMHKLGCPRLLEDDGLADRWEDDDGPRRVASTG